jgi:feruloyl esterase
MRVFMVPGLSHQPPSSGGPISFDMIAPLEQWVEKGIAPERIVVSYLKEGKVERTRPACPYPQVPAYSGAGTPEDAANFRCRMR